ncbi:MAG: urea ABC transporter permease subunit UrtB [Anaerolineae bacterium]|nr:urea ABC transporter permease subunit UrtB [Anaerolineae bacterium]MCB9104299.1 urea ABC transporter permease subunit UrtB [Anaerolineales bacterium]
MVGWLAQLFNGISLGSILLMISLGLAFSFGLMKVINMAHGEFIMVGAYVTYVFQNTFADMLGGVDLGIWFILSLFAAFIITGILGVILEVGLIRFLYGRPLDTLLATFGVALVLQQAARSIFGAPNVQVVSPSWLSGGVNIGIMVLPYKRLFIIALVIVLVALIYVYLNRTAAGRRLRAVMQNREMAAALGVRSRQVDALTFGVGAGLAGVAGCVLTLIGPIGPTLGTNYIVDAFMVVVLGGTGSLLGTILAAMMIGIFSSVIEFSTTATIAKALVFVMIVAFLQWRPTGLVAQRAR